MVSIHTELRYSLVQPSTSMSQCDCNCDCHFALSSMQGNTGETPKNLLQEGVWQSRDSLFLRRVNSDYWIAQDLVPGGQPVLLRDRAMDILRSLRNPRTLIDVEQTFSDLPPVMVENTMRRMADWMLLRPVNLRLHSTCAQQSQILVAWLHVVSACNLVCSYCYLDKTTGLMSLSIGQRAIDAVFRSAQQNGYSAVKLKYAGGEPTLHLPRVLQLHNYAAIQAENQHLGLEEVILSNGTLLSTKSIEHLRQNGIRLMISLDGIGEFQDMQRRFAEDKGSFAIVARNIDPALEHGLVPDISITISNRNLDGLRDVVSYVLERHLPFSLNFYRENDYSMAARDLNFSEQQIIEAMYQAYKAIEENIPRWSLLGSLSDRASLIAPHNYTCGVGQDYLVIGPHGGIAKCQMQMSHLVTDIHTEDPLQSLRADHSGIQNKNVDEKEGCRDCSWRYWCAGGCPLATFRETGRYDTKSPNCNIYKALFPEILKLEGLRLLKYCSEVSME